MLFWMRWIYTIVRAFLYRFFSTSIDYKKEFEYRFLITPIDIDMNFTVEHSTMFAMLEYARIDYIIQSGLYVEGMKRGIYFMIGGTSYQFRRPVPLSMRFVTVKTHLVGVDDKWWYLEQSIYDSKKRFVGRGLMRMAAVRSRVKDPAQRKTLSGEQFIETFFGGSQEYETHWANSQNLDIIATFREHDTHLKESNIKEH